MASLKKRGDVFYIQFYVGNQQRRISTNTDSYQLAKEKLRQFESAQMRGDDNPLPTRTDISAVVTAYVNHIRTAKTAKSAQTDIYYLRDAFGPICEAIQITSRKIGPASKKRPPKPGQDRRRRAVSITAPCFEQIGTADIAQFISGQVQSRGLAPKTANRYREILCRLFNWSMEQRAVRMPSGRNPAAAVERYKEHAPEIRFLTLAQGDKQLNTLAEKPKLQTMVAMLIYAGLRREIVTLDSQEPATGKRKRLDSVMDFACGSGSLLLNVRKRMGPHGIGKIYGQEKNITTYNLCRMNMLLHGVKDTEFDIYHGDTLTNDWDMLRETNPAKKPKFDAVVANPPFSYRWDSNEAMGEDVRFKSHGLAPKSAADFAFLLHGFHYLKDEGVMAIILPHGVLFRGGAEERIRTKLLKDGHIDTVIGLPANLFYSTGIPVCILVLKKCKKPDDVLFINASEHFVKGKRQNQLTEEHIKKIVETYQFRKPEDRYSKRVTMQEIEANDFNLNISRYVSIAEDEAQIDLATTHSELVKIDNTIQQATAKHNEFLKELGLSPLP